MDLVLILVLYNLIISATFAVLYSEEKKKNSDSNSYHYKIIVDGIEQGKPNKNGAGILTTNQQMFIVYNETWTLGAAAYKAFTANGTEFLNSPYYNIDVNILAFGTMQFSMVQNNILIGGINGANSSFNTATKYWAKQRLSAKRDVLQILIEDDTYELDDAINSLGDPLQGVQQLQNYISGFRTNCNRNAKLWISFGGANGSNAELFAAITKQNIVDIFATYDIDGIDLDIENTLIDPDVFLSQCQVIRSGMPAGKTLCLCIETTQTMPTRASQYASIWKYKDCNVLFDYVSLQFYNYCYPTDPTSTDTNPIGDIPQLIAYGFHPKQIILGLNPGQDECGSTKNPDGTTQYNGWITDANPQIGTFDPSLGNGNYLEMLKYVKDAQLGGVFLWALQRDSSSGNNGDNTAINNLSNFLFPFARSPQDGKQLPLSWGPPWPAQYINQTIVTPYTSGQFGSAIVTSFQLAPA